MKSITNWKEIIFDSLGEIVKNIMEALPNILGAIIILIIGWIITKIVTYILSKILRLVKIDKLTNAINEKNLFSKADFSINVLNVILGFVKWILYLVFLIVACDIMNWDVVSKAIGDLILYLPTLFSAIVLFIIGLYLADFAKKAINRLFESIDLNGGKIISKLLFYVIVVLISITALNQAGINTDIITNNLTIIFGAILASFAIAFGLGSKEVIGVLLKSFYVRKKYETGQTIKFKNNSGTT